MDIHQLLNTMVKMEASDLHITVDSPPVLRIHGKIYPLKTAELSADDTQSLAYSVLSNKQKKHFEEEHEIDFSFAWKKRSRFRANFFKQRGVVAGAFRLIPNDIRQLESLGLPESVSSLFTRPSGLILVTGPTGSGKTSTLAAMVDRINDSHRGHIVTIEDPIEYMHSHKQCIINQREVGSDTSSFSAALRYILRQDPDFVLLGEIRDRDSMEAALRISETGHLVLATLHTNSSVQTIHRVIDFFPASQQDMVRTQLSFVLTAVISQQLVPNHDSKGVSLASEVMIPNAAIRNLIREDKTHQIYSQMQTGQNTHGMQTLNQSLCHLVSSEKIAEATALGVANEREELIGMLSNLPQRVGKFDKVNEA